ncbi:MAG TPA: hypothetical protein VNA89_13995 [Gemmatimonadaceae bacterium]|nr:hypothetical protein [Gemmatimonadaceae bacterium]
MRMVRPLTLAFGALALLPATGAAQSGRYFQNAWFWGAKAGNMTYWTRGKSSPSQAVQFGGEWLITRKRGGLYVAFDKVFFNTLYSGSQTTYIDDPLNTDDGGVRYIDFDDMRRLTFAAMAFPKQFGPFRPYGGLGLAVNWITEAVPRGGFSTAQQAADIMMAVEDAKTRTAPIFILGTQMQLFRMSAFGQASYMPAERRFLLNDRGTYFFEVGVRYNVGSSVEGIDR